jgi:hypothetical protein
MLLWLNVAPRSSGSPEQPSRQMRLTGSSGHPRWPLAAESLGQRAAPGFVSDKLLRPALAAHGLALPSRRPSLATKVGLLELRDGPPRLGGRGSVPRDTIKRVEAWILAERVFEDNQSIAPRIKNARGDGAPELVRSDALTSTVFQFGRTLILFHSVTNFTLRRPPPVMASGSFGRPAELAS